MRAEAEGVSVALAAREVLAPRTLASRLSEVRGAARLDLGEVLRSRWPVFTGGAYALLAAVFINAGLRESTTMGFTGLGRVLLALSHALVLVLPLLALMATGQVISRARDDGTLELLFSHPITRAGWFTGVTLVRLGALVLPLALLLLLLPAAGRLLGLTVPWAFALRTVAVGTSLLVAFSGIGMALSASVRNGAKVVVLLLMAWALAVALLDFGLIAFLLRARVAPRAVLLLAALNPVQSARLALLAGADPDLSTLGPVGFWAATHLGSGRMLALGVLWPLAVGALSWTAGLRRFCRGDLV